MLLARLNSSHEFVSADRARSCICGVCVMSMPLPVHLYQELKPAPIIYVPCTELPLVQRIALVTMRRGELAAKVLDACKQIDVPSPHLPDFRALVEQNYATRNAQYYRLTPIGVHAADEVTRALAKQLGIHHFTEGGVSRFILSLRCTCGWNAGHSKNEGHWTSAQMRLRSRHLQ